MDRGRVQVHRPSACPIESGQAVQSPSASRGDDDIGDASWALLRTEGHSRVAEQMTSARVTPTVPCFGPAGLGIGAYAPVSAWLTPSRARKRRRSSIGRQRPARVIVEALFQPVRRLPGAAP
jgi:hypothetical protein